MPPGGGLGCGSILLRHSRCYFRFAVLVGFGGVGNFGA
jgi:hypothetical protein